MENHSTFGPGTQALEQHDALSIERELPYQIVVRGDEAVVWASQIDPLTHEQVEALIASIRRFYSRMTPDELEKWRYDLRMNSPAGVYRKGRDGRVYLFTDGTLYKIGITSRTVATRLKQVEQDCGRPLTCVWSIFVDDAPDFEARLHSVFSEKRVSGEWFNLSPEDVGYITSLDGTE